jgi:hypothetical protein
MTQCHTKDLRTLVIPVSPGDSFVPLQAAGFRTDYRDRIVDPSGELVRGSDGFAFEAHGGVVTGSTCIETDEAMVPFLGV